MFQGEKICAGAFHFLYFLGTKSFINLKKHVVGNGAVPHVHGIIGKRRHNALSFSDVEFGAHFKEFGLPHTAPLHGRADMPPVYLPASKTSKSVHAEYVAVYGTAKHRAAGVSVFRSIWHSCFPHVQFMSHRTDIHLRRHGTSACAGKKLSKSSRVNTVNFDTKFLLFFGQIESSPKSTLTSIKKNI